MAKMLVLARWATLLGYFGLFALLLSWFTLLAPSQHFPTSVVLLVFLGPLLFPLRGLLHGRKYTHAWTAFLVLLYFIHGVVESWANPEERGLALLEILFSLLLFFGCLFFVRLSNRLAAGQNLKADATN